MIPQASIHTDPSCPVISPRRVSPAQTHSIDGLTKQNPLVEAIRVMGATMTFPSEAEIFGEGEKADYAYVAGPFTCTEKSRRSARFVANRNARQPMTSSAWLSVLFARLR
jgi:hypothetical protein